MRMLHQRREPFLVSSRKNQPQPRHAFTSSRSGEVSRATADSTMRRRNVVTPARLASMRRTTRPRAVPNVAAEAARAASRASASRSAAGGARGTDTPENTRETLAQLPQLPQLPIAGAPRERPGLGSREEANGLPEAEHLLEAGQI